MQHQPLDIGLIETVRDRGRFLPGKALAQGPFVVREGRNRVDQNSFEIIRVEHAFGLGPDHHIG